LCNPNTVSTETPTFPKAAFIRRDAALRNAFLFCGVLLTENWLPSIPINRRP